MKVISWSIFEFSIYSTGHGATIHAAQIEDGALVGMGATVLDGATVSPRQIICSSASAG